MVAVARWRAWAVENGVPGYYGEYLAKIESKVRSLMKPCAGGFFFITDPHVKSNHCKSGLLIAELIRRTGLDLVLCGGDIVEAFGAGYPTDKDAVDFAIDRFTSLWVKPIRAAGGRLYSAKGNHDFTVRHSMKPEDGNKGFTYSGAEAKKIIIDGWTERDIVANASDPSGCYYYFDDDKARVRYVVADTSDSEVAGNTGWGVRYSLREPQLKWLAGTALKTVPRGFGVVVMHHIPAATVVGSVADGVRFKRLRELLNQYQRRGKFVVEGSEYDFSDAGGEMLLDLTGHHHAERQTFQDGVLHITEPCDAAYRDYVYGSAPWCGNLPDKNGGTVFEQTFDIVQIDRANGTIHLTRVGGGQDRVIHLRPLKVTQGGARQVTPVHVKNHLKFRCYDCDKVEFKPNPANKYCSLVEYKSEFASVDDSGVVKGLRPGEALVLAMDDGFNKEIFPVEVSAET